MTIVQTQPKYATQDIALVPREVEALFPSIFQLKNDELGKEAVRIMNDRFKGNDYVVLKNLGNENQPVAHSNPYRRWALGPIVRELKREVGDNVELLTPAVSEQALRSGRLPDVTSTYEDLGVVVYSLNGPNDKLAQHLVNQARERGFVAKSPMVFYHLKTARDGKFPDGLRLDLDDNAVIYHASILSNHTSNFKADNKGLAQTGLPDEVGEGNRILYTAQEGLRGLYRDRDSGLNANDDNLPYSIEAGRVSFMRKGAAPQNLEARLGELNAERERQIQEVEARFGMALQIMTGK